MSNSTSDAGFDGPSKELVRALMKTCNCTEMRATALLQRCGNDLLKAKRHHDAVTKYSSRPTRASTATPTRESTCHSPVSKNSSKPREGSECSFTFPIDVITDDDDDSEPSTIDRGKRDPKEMPCKEPLLDPSPSPPSQSSMDDEISALMFEKLPKYPSAGATSNINAPVHSRAAPSRTEMGNPIDSEPDDDQYGWDFILPVLPFYRRLPLHSSLHLDQFSAKACAGALQHGTATADEMRVYLSSHRDGLVQRHINDEVNGFPLIFYAVATNSEDMVRLFLSFGADVSAVDEASQVPLLAFAIVNGDTLQTDTTTMVSILLSHGASPNVMPSEIFTPYTQDLSIGSIKSDGDDKAMEMTELTEWCTEEARAKLVRAANITQRYYLERATKIRQPSKRERQIAERKGAQALLGVPYFLIGQSVAAKLLIQRLLNHLLFPAKEPLVLCFAGPSGHGKTEMARQLGHLLSLELEVVDCTIVTREIELFGPRQPYMGADNGSPINNFLARHSGERCIVFLDEFEKTTRDIHQALLLPFDSGEYQDRRDRSKIDCSRTIWILATNALDDTILDFCQQNDVLFGDDDNPEKSRIAKRLSRQLQEDFLKHFGAPMTGRVSGFVPFLPFSEGEQAVITHKSLRELARELRLPINLQPGPRERLIGDIRLSVRRDATVCRMLAREHYHRQLGARSLRDGANRVKRDVVDSYTQGDDEIEENGGLREYIVDVQGDEIIVRAEETF